MRTEPSGAPCPEKAAGSFPRSGKAASARPLAVYLHIPFCVKKCAYCDFLSFPLPAAAGEAEGRQRRYFDALLCEADAAAKALPACAYEVRSVYFGGGTPSLVPARLIAAMLARLRERFAFAADVEISIECNPGTADVEKLRGLRGAGINRLSIGAQSFDDGELKLLGRIHTAADVARCFADARAAGFDNVNLDLMAALPGQTGEALLDNLRRALSLSPEHLSLYSLSIEPGTPFYERYAEEVEDPHFDRPAKRGAARASADARTGSDPAAFLDAGAAPHLPGEDEEREMLHAAWTVLSDAGYARYEISNFARVKNEKPLRAAGGEPAGRTHGDWRCLQNLAYWERGDYLGLGLGAASLIDNVRFSNTRDMRRYLAAFAGGGRPAGQPGADAGDPSASADALFCVRENREALTEEAQMEEFMFLGLRLVEGVRTARFADVFGRELDEVYGETVGQLAADGLLARRDGRLFLTDRGTDLANYVMAQFLLT